MSRILYSEQDNYLRTLVQPKNALLAEMEAYAAANRVPILQDVSASYIELQVALLKPRKVLEVGTAIAYTAIRIASRLPRGGEIITLEKSPGSVKLATEYIQRAGYSDVISIVAGEAASYIQTTTEQFDMIFLDADKKDYCAFLPDLVRLLRPGGILLVDNLLWQGYTAMKDEDIPESYKSSTENVRAFNKMFFAHPELETVMLPLGDGLGIARKHE